MGLQANGVVVELHGGLGVEEYGEEYVEHDAAYREAHHEPLHRSNGLFVIKHCSVCYSA